MRKLLFLSFIIALFGIVNAPVFAQSATVLTGEVTTLGENKIGLQTKDGAVDVQLSGKTEFKRVSPDNPSMKTATASTLTDISVGDKIAVTGVLATDKKSIPARAVYLMTKADITKRNDDELNAWRTRSISGRVVSTDPSNQQFTLAVRGMMGEQNVVVSPKLNVRYRRYAPDSVKFDDAKDSSFAELKVGDQVRALGDKSEDGATFRAERVVAGSFKTVAGTITAIDPAKNEITIKDIQTNKPVTVAINANSTLKKFPQEFAQMMAMRAQGGTAQPPNGSGGQGQPQGGQPNTGQRPPQATGEQGQAPNGGMRQGGGMRRGDINDMLDRFPTISLADLKVGDQIAFSSSAGADPSRATAIKLVAGVEPFLRARQFGGGGRRNGGGFGNGGGQDSGLGIPGLDDGIGAP